MNKKNKLAWGLEIIWWIFTAVMVVGVMYPIVSRLANYPFYWSNVAFVVIFITIARYIFLLRHTFLANREKVKLVLLFLCIPLIFWLIGEINYFQTYLDEEGIMSFMPELTGGEQENMSNYIRTEMIFFGVAATISAIIFPFRMVVSVWRARNRGTV